MLPGSIQRNSGGKGSRLRTARVRKRARVRTQAGNPHRTPFPVIANWLRKPGHQSKLLGSPDSFRKLLVEIGKSRQCTFQPQRGCISNPPKSARALSPVVTTVDTQTSRDSAGRISTRIICDVPLAQASALTEKLRTNGIVRLLQSTRDPSAPSGRFATARLNVTLSNGDPIVAKDDGLWTQIRRSLSISVTVLLMSVTRVVFGLCVVLPWFVIGYSGYRLIRRLAPRPGVASQSTVTTV
jgi:hypothetical protein